MKKENQYLYLVKAIACVFVIFIHCPMDGWMGGCMTAIARAAVPTFFIISGRFFKLTSLGHDENMSNINKNYVRRVRVLLTQFITVFVIYTCIAYLMEVRMGDMSLGYWLTNRYSVSQWICLLLVNSSRVLSDGVFMYDHLWFLLAMLYVVLIASCISRYINKNVCHVVMILVMVPVMTNLLGINKDIYIGNLMIPAGFTTRNFLFTGLPFFFAGIEINLKQQEREKNELSTKIALPIMVTIGGIVSTIIEYAIQGEKELYLGSALLAYGVVWMAEYLPPMRRNIISSFGKNMSKYVYFYHPLVRMVIGISNPHSTAGQTQISIMVVVMSIVMAYVLYSGKSIAKKWKNAWI